MITILKEIKNELIKNLSGQYTISITAPDVAENIDIPLDGLPFIAVAPLSTSRAVQSTRHILPTHQIQIKVLDHFPFKEETVVGGTANKGIIGHVNDMVKIVEFNTLSDYLRKGAMTVESISYGSLAREAELFQIATLTCTVLAPLKTVD